MASGDQSSVGGSASNSIGVDYAEAETYVVNTSTTVPQELRKLVIIQRTVEIGDL
jgi:hypothetical protein